MLKTSIVLLLEHDVMLRLNNAFARLTRLALTVNSAISRVHAKRRVVVAETQNALVKMNFVI